MGQRGWKRRRSVVTPASKVRIFPQVAQWTSPPAGVHDGLRLQWDWPRLMLLHHGGNSINRDKPSLKEASASPRKAATI
ncbi:hypothetical protein ACFX1Q_009160 [Malus domestica]